MISGICGAGNLMGNMAMGAMRPNPAERFNNADTNGDGGLDKAEMQTITDRISEMSGQDISVDDVFSEFDADEDGLLSEQEAETAMAQLKEDMGPEMRGRMGRGAGMRAYEDAAEDETESAIVSLLNSLSEEDESVLDILNNDSENEEEEGSEIADMLSSALESGSYSPLDVVV